MELMTFADALKETTENSRTLLLGNGFSIAQTEGHFSYANLLDKSDSIKGTSIYNMFDSFATFDFEQIIKLLEDASRVASVYGNKSDSTKYSEDAEALRGVLIKTIRDVHPDNFGSIPQSEIESCAKFIKCFRCIFSLNYDLLLYWTCLKYNESVNNPDDKFKDGFGLAKDSDGFRGPFKEEAYCNIYNIHGGLHLFLTPERNVEKKVSTSNNLLNDIAQIIQSHKRLPLYVAEGACLQKLNKIRSVPYIAHCYDKLSDIDGDLFCFGHSINKNDHHIYDVIFSEGSKVKTFYYCVYDIEKLQHSKERLAAFKEKNPRIEVKYIDASKMDIWGKNKA